MIKRTKVPLQTAVQILKSHPDTLWPLRMSLEELGAIPHWKEGGYTAWLARADVLILKVLNAPDDMRGDYFSARDKRRMRKHGVKELNGYLHEVRLLHRNINKRWELKQHIDKCARDGMIGLIESGRDCDCVQYVHPAGTCPATVADYLIRESRMLEGADGPCRLGIVTPEEAKAQGYESRDLALEAFEDGHPHVVYSSFP